MPANPTVKLIGTYVGIALIQWQDRCEGRDVPQDEDGIKQYAVTLNARFLEKSNSDVFFRSVVLNTTNSILKAAAR